MLSIGEFSRICRVSTKTLRYYDDIGLIKPKEINPKTGYRYYTANQLQTMLFIIRLKNYGFSLDEIREILYSEEQISENLYSGLLGKKRQCMEQIRCLQSTCISIERDLESIKSGKSIMSYMDDIGVELSEVEKMNLVSVRKMVSQENFSQEYSNCFSLVFSKILQNKFTPDAPPMVLFYSDHFAADGMDTEFAVPIKEYATGSRDFIPGLCLKSTLKGSYSNLPSVYAKIVEYAESNGFKANGPLYEVYVSPPEEREENLITQVYYPVKKSAD